MKVLLHYPKWNNRWIPYIEHELSRYDVTVCHSYSSKELRLLSEKADLLISMWCDPCVTLWSQEFPEKKIITYIRRYEMWSNNLFRWTSFPRIDAVIFVSEYYKRLFENGMVEQPQRTYCIPNGIDLSQFPFRPKRAGTNKVALVGQMKSVKNFPLAVQVLMGLPKSYTAHQIGLPANEMQIGQFVSYVDNLGFNGRWTVYPPITPESMIDWYKDKDYILSTSLNEGNPNCVIEAMAMGIKPVIHNWPGARDQFPVDLIWDEIGYAADLMTCDEYQPGRYRQWVEERYGLDNYKQLHKVIEEITQ